MFIIFIKKKYHKRNSNPNCSKILENINGNGNSGNIEDIGDISNVKDIQNCYDIFAYINF